MNENAIDIDPTSDDDLIELAGSLEIGSEVTVSVPLWAIADEPAEDAAWYYEVTHDECRSPFICAATDCDCEPLQIRFDVIGWTKTHAWRGADIQMVLKLVKREMGFAADAVEVM